MIDTMKNLFDKMFGARKPQPQPTSEYWEVQARLGFMTVLSDLGERSGATPAQVLDRAVGLYAHAVQQAEEGKVIAFVTEEQREELTRQETTE
jgi:hypothetical protein